MNQYMIEGRDKRGKDAAWNKVQGFRSDSDTEAQAYLERLKGENRLRRQYKRYRIVRL